VILEPPFDTGGVNEMVACPLPATALTLVGVPGTVAGVTELLETDAVLVPIAFVAVTENVYAVPFVRPVSVIGEPPP
jgi:phage shock protein PspC (stress-responsive transcriptional regulator)